MAAVSLPDGSNRSAPRLAVLLTGLMLVTLVALSPARPVAAQSEPTDRSPEQELVERHAPIVMVREQSAPCDTDGEPFEPAPVDIVLENPEIFLRQVGNDDPVAQRGPSGADLFDLREGWYLDFPGDALEPGCIFEQDFWRFYDGQSVTYAHIAVEDDRPGFLAVQYWFFWYHNPAKNDHEGDWEFVQLLFEADSVTEALAADPVSIGYAQHTGGERAVWSDERIERVDGRPVVYAAQGSHASYFESGHFLGRSSSEGFGCDDTTGPSRRLDPAVVLLPAAVDDADDPFAWLAFQGRWGQREPSFLNGPTGPFAKDRWSAPVSWHEGLRTSSVMIPGGERFGNDVVGTFCRSAEVGSTVLTRTLRSPLTTVVVVTLMLLAAIRLVRSTRWSPVEVRPLRSERAVGQILRASVRVWRRRPGVMLTVGLLYAPVAVATAVIQAGVFAMPFVDELVEVAGERSGVAFLISIAIGGLADLLTFVFIVAIVVRAMDDDTPARPVVPSWSEIGLLLRAVARAAVVVGALLLSVVGIPWAIRQLVRYQFAPQAIVTEGADAKGALRRSTELVRGRWWWTAGVVLGVEVVVATIGFGVAVAVLLIVRTLPLWGFNLVSSAIYVLLVPVAAAAVSYAYGTLTARAGASREPEMVSQPTTS
ncbi:MAG: hypothetical protein CL424_04340 [Acidimicrobiaceae bacterium]|nr:hypothetical protein [Acidimicrobiaceae bacterium]